jgi:hypothetical protein
VDYIDLDLIKRQYPEFINASRQFFLNTKPLEASVYWDEVHMENQIKSEKVTVEK